MTAPLIINSISVCLWKSFGNKIYRKVTYKYEKNKALYGHTLEEYLKIEFLNDHVQSFDCMQRIPFWSDIIEGNR